MANIQAVWLRNDVRIDDHPALYKAQQQGPVHVVYVATPKQWQQHHESPARLGLKAAALRDIAERLADLGIQFTLLETDWFKDTPAVLQKFCDDENISELWFQLETPWDENQRDEAVEATLKNIGIAVHALPYDLLVPQPVKTQQDDPFKVFTPYYRRWLQILEDTQQAPYPFPKSQGKALTKPKLDCHWAGAFREDLWPGDEESILLRLSSFAEFKIQDYKKQRDFPIKPATSVLSPYLANGQLGPRRLLAVVQFFCGEQNRDWRHDDWLRELAWRDFYRQLLLHFPKISKHQPFKPETKYVQWRDDEAGFKAWCDGKTGFPIVDAAMRQLNQTGWMHNRLRMIAASFLTKLMLTHWRRGEDYFMDKLIDGEFASNNGGWQWSASTGVDAAPYFRVFNPTLQSERYDPEGKFIKRFVPELADVPAKQIHNPPAELREQCGYPQPVVDYKPARQAAIAAFKDLSAN